MRTQRTMMAGIAAAALTLTACGVVSSSSGAVPGGQHPAPASARHAPAAAPVTEQEALAWYKGHLAWPAGVQRPRADASSVTFQADLARYKSIAFHGGQLVSARG